MEKGDEKATEFIGVKLTPAEKQAYSDAAKARGDSLSEFIRGHMNTAVKRPAPKLDEVASRAVLRAFRRSPERLRSDLAAIAEAAAREPAVAAVVRGLARLLPPRGADGLQPRARRKKRASGSGGEPGKG